MTHTPGPWKVDKLGTMGDYDLCSNNYPLGMLYHSQIHDTEANARLIAAAPELLETLKELLAMAKFYKPIPKPANPEDEDEEMWSIAMVYIKAEKAIAKAEGT